VGLFDKLFGGKKKKVFEPADLSVLKTDVHSHLIPGIDDGAQTMEDSVQLIRELSKFGYQKLITTPHIMSDYYKNTPEIILGGLEDVKKAIAAEGIEIELEAAAEYYMDFDFEEKLKEKNLLTFGKNYVLFELSFFNEPPDLERLVFDMQTAGYKPVLAHVERYPFWYGNTEKYERMKDLGLLFQVNMGSLAGHYGPAAKKVAEELIEKGVIELIGSDLHNMSHIEVVERARTEEFLHKAIDSGNLRNVEL
jgi:protein-tyrosine phosphatase